MCAGKGGETFVPAGTIDDICSKSLTICNINLKTGNLQGSEINIEQKCGEQEGEPSEPSDGSTDGTPAPMDGHPRYHLHLHLGSPSVPSTPTPSPTPTPTIHHPRSWQTTASTEELQAFYEKPSVQIGTVVSSLVSVSSCALLIMLVM